MLSSRRSSWPRIEPASVSLCLFHLQVDCLPLVPPEAQHIFWTVTGKKGTSIYLQKLAGHQALHEDTLYSNTWWHFCPMESVFIFPCFIEKQKSAWRRSVPCSWPSLESRNTGEQTQVCLDAPNALALVPGGQRHTPDVSVPQGGSRPLCVCV